jgi:hypothetical protein
MTIISLAAGVTAVGDEVVKETQEGQALEQGVRGFVNAHETGTEYTEIGSQDPFATSSKTANVKTIGGETVAYADTEIEVDPSGGGSSYTFDNTPIKIGHDSFDLYYDAGVIASVSDGQGTTHWTPISNGKSSDKVIKFTTYDTNGSLVEDKSVVRLSITQSRPPEVFRVGDGAEIIVNTETPHGWKEYLSTYDFLDDVTSTPSGDGVKITADVSVDPSDTVLIQNQEVGLDTVR